MRVGDASTRDGKILIGPTPRGPARGERAASERPAPASPPERAAGEPSPFARVLQGLGTEVDRGEALVRRVSGGSYGGGKEIGNLELLSLQAGIYRYSEAVDLAAKLVDRAASGVKTVLQGQ